jgi:uncharacterized tellurite resistance protein B-like protein
MSVIDKVLQGQPEKTAALSPQDAVLAVLVAAIAADGELAPAEGARLNALVSSMRLCRGVGPDQLPHMINHALQLVTGTTPDALLPACAAAIPEELRASVFALAVELVFADGTIAEREKGFIDALQAALAVDEATAMKIVEVLLIRNRA